VKEMSFESGVKCRGSDRWCEWRWWLWWGDMCRMRWTRITVNRMSPLVYNNMGWLGDGSHSGQGCQAWTAVGLPPRYPRHRPKRNPVIYTYPCSHPTILQSKLIGDLKDITKSIYKQQTVVQSLESINTQKLIIYENNRLPRTIHTYDYDTL